MMQLTNEELLEQERRDIQRLNVRFWLLVHRAAIRDWQQACATFGIDRSMAHRLMRMCEDEVIEMAETASSITPHFVYDRSKAMDLLWAQMESQEDATKIQASRIASVVQSLQSRIGD